MPDDDRTRGVSVLAYDPHRRTNARAIAELARLGIVRDDDRILDVDDSDALLESSISANARFVELVARRLRLTDHDVAAMRAQAATDSYRREANLCRRCAESVDDERFMLHDDVWSVATDGDSYGYLCVGCVEEQLGRELTVDDFTDCPLNTDERFDRSSRLRDRLTPKLFSTNGVS